MVKDTTKVRARLEALFPKAAGLSKERIDALAAKLTVTDDSTDEELDAELQQRNDNGLHTFEEVKIEDDRIRTELAKAKKPAAPATPPAQDPPAEPEPNEPAAETAMEKRLKALEELLAKKEAEEQRRSLSDRFKTDERLKGIPEWMVNKSIPATEEEFEASVTELADNYKAFATENKLGAFGKDTPPAGTPPKKDTDQVSDEEAQQITKKLLNL